ALMALVAGAVVAAFEAVGSILVIAMLICPAATARLLTDRLSRQVWLSALIAAATAGIGYWLAADAPRLFGAQSALSAAGMMAVTSGAALALAIVAAPRYGLVGRWTARRAASGSADACPVCQYDLTGVGRPRACPECGWGGARD